jgi:hypothetical protein
MNEEYYSIPFIIITYKDNNKDCIFIQKEKIINKNNYNLTLNDLLIDLNKYERVIVIFEDNKWEISKKEIEYYKEIIKFDDNIIKIETSKYYYKKS